IWASGAMRFITPWHVPTKSSLRPKSLKNVMNTRGSLAVGHRRGPGRSDLSLLLVRVELTGVGPTSAHEHLARLALKACEPRSDEGDVQEQEHEHDAVRCSHELPLAHSSTLDAIERVRRGADVLASASQSRASLRLIAGLPGARAGSRRAVCPRARRGTGR